MVNEDLAITKITKTNNVSFFRFMLAGASSGIICGVISASEYITDFIIECFNNFYYRNATIGDILRFWFYEITNMRNIEVFYDNQENKVAVIYNPSGCVYKGLFIGCLIGFFCYNGYRYYCSSNNRKDENIQWYNVMTQ